ncbi:jg22573, partial [Pararge aegeria aegeria]
RPYKYFYGMGSDVDTEYSGRIIKVDTETGNYKQWYEPQCYPSEPIFIPHPDAKVNKFDLITKHNKLLAIEWQVVPFYGMQIITTP